MDPYKLINVEELSEKVQSDKALEWVESLMGRFHTTKEARDLSRLRNRVTQELFYELLPLANYAKKHYNDPNVLLKFYPGSENSFDAEFINLNGTLVERVEVTMAIDGQQSRIQAEALNQFGHFSVYHTPEYSGKSKSRKIKEPSCTTISTDALIDLHASRIQKAYIDKHKNLHKYPNITLLIGVDMPFLMLWEYQAIIQKIELQQNTFQSVKIVNVSSNNYWNLI